MNLASELRFCVLILLTLFDADGPFSTRPVEVSVEVRLRLVVRRTSPGTTKVHGQAESCAGDVAAPPSIAAARDPHGASDRHVRPVAGRAEGRSTREIPHVVIDVEDAPRAGRHVAPSERIVSAWTHVAPGQDVAAPLGTCSAEDALRGSRSKRSCMDGISRSRQASR
jgi:hypothetical protein